MYEPVTLLQVLSVEDFLPACDSPEPLVCTTAITCLPHLDNPAPAAQLLLDKLSSSSNAEAAVALRLLLRVQPTAVLPALKELLTPRPAAAVTASTRAAAAAGSSAGQAAGVTSSAGVAQRADTSSSGVMKISGQVQAVRLLIATDTPEVGCFCRGRGALSAGCKRCQGCGSACWCRCQGRSRCGLHTAKAGRRTGGLVGSIIRPCVDGCWPPCARAPGIACRARCSMWGGSPVFAQCRAS